MTTRAPRPISIENPPSRRILIQLNWQLASSIFILLGIVLIAQIMKRTRILNTEHGEVLAKLVLNITLPALIFHSLYHAKITPGYFGLVGITIATCLICLGIAWATGKVMKLSRPHMGALLLTAAFGSSGLIGYVVIAQTYPGNSEALAIAAMISEVAVAPLVFTVGVMIAMHYGDADNKKTGVLQSAWNFARSPIFIALTAGLLCSFAGAPKPTGLMKTVFSGLDTVANANTFLAAMIVGLLLSFQNFKSAAKVAFAASVIKLIAQPIIAWLPLQIMAFPPLEQEILIIESAMPAMTLSVVFAKVYGCDTQSTSIALLATNIFSIFTLIGVSSILV